VTRRHVTTLVYAVHEERVLLLHRKKEPNLGLWSPPGGKVEQGETPLENALRELTEETGAVGLNARLSAVVSERDAVRDEDWLLFVFRVDVDAHDPALFEPAGEDREGTPAWVSIATIDQLPKPPADLYILSTVLEDRPGVAFMGVDFEDGALVDVRVDWAWAGEWFGHGDDEWD
jgi:8-oxo-dGTP diphosphatase